MHNGPVGVFDSGLGGISVLRCLLEIMPEENYIFYGDSANAPYGTRSDEEVCALSEQVFDRLLDMGAKAILIACNTATSAAAKKLRRQYPRLPIVGMEPALKPAAENHQGGRIVVMATPVTLRRQKFARLMARYAEDSEIISLPCPDIVSYIEQGRLQDPALEQYVQDRFASIGGSPVDAVVLGCTHFPFAAEIIQKAAGPQAVLYDGNLGTSRELRRRMDRCGLLTDRTGKGTVTLLNSAGQEQIRRSEELLYGAQKH